VAEGFETAAAHHSGHSANQRDLHESKDFQPKQFNFPDNSNYLRKYQMLVVVCVHACACMAACVCTWGGGKSIFRDNSNHLGG